MTFKLWGSLLVITACGCFGFAIASAHRKEVRSLRGLITALQYMECELGYRLTALPELFEKAASVSMGAVSRFFTTTAYELNSQIQPDIGQCINAALNQVKDLPISSRDGVLELAISLGAFGVQGQLDSLRKTKALCEDRLNKLTADQDVRLRSYQTLGICAGAALAIVLM